MIFPYTNTNCDDLIFCDPNLLTAIGISPGKKLEFEARVYESRECAESFIVYLSDDSLNYIWTNFGNGPFFYS